MTVVPGELTIQDVDVFAGGLQLLHGIGFSLRAGELCALIGPSGAGKSTLIKVLLGLRRPERGRVELGGRPVQAAGPVGYVPQEDALHRTLTVRHALDFAVQLRLPGLDGAARTHRLELVCRQVGLEDRLDTRIARLSGGQRKRVSVAMELLTSPPLLILDEPTSGLDPGLEARMMALFQEVARSGRIVLVATHAMENLSRCDALLVLVKGHLAYAGSPAGALEFFRTDRFAGIFAQLEKQAPAAWARAYAQSQARASFIGRSVPRIGAEGGDGPAPLEPGAPTGPETGLEGGGGMADRTALEAQLRALKEQYGRGKP